VTSASPPLSGTSEVLAGFGAVKRLESRGPIALFTGWSDTHQANVLVHRVDAAAFATPGPAQRFLEVAKNATGLKHSRVMPPLGLTQLPDGAWCMASAFAPGATLAAELERQGPLKLSDALGLVLSLAQGLVVAHARGLVHAAIRPEAVLLGPRGISDARLNGFAIAALPWPEGLAGLAQEAPGYAAPELASGAAPTPASDVYSMAALLCAAVSGRAPIPDDNLSTTPLREVKSPRITLPAMLTEMQPAVLRALSEDPSRRPQSIEELMAELGKTGDTLIPHASPPSTSTSSPSLIPLPPPVRSAPGEERPGDVMGAYTLVKELGEGSMGKVFLARHAMLGRQVALKLLKAEQLDRPELIGRFFQEARAVNQINHEHIVEIFDFVQEQGPEGLQAVYCLMELLKGETLAAAVESRALTLKRVLHIMLQVCDALDAAHQVGVVHRDLKPDNIFLIERGGHADYVKVLDFGVSKLTTSANELPLVATVDGVVIGTPAYMSPEQISGEHVDARSDIYAAGVILHELLTCHLPFEASNFALLSTQILTREPPPLPPMMPSGDPIPDSLRALALKLLAKDKTQRPQSMREVKEALVAIESGHFSSPAIPVVTPPLTAPAAASSRAPMIALALIAVAAGAFGLSQMGSKNEVLPPPPVVVKPEPVPLPPPPPPPVVDPTPPPVVATPTPPTPTPTTVKERPVVPLTPKDIGTVVGRSKAKLLSCFEKNAGQLQESTGKVEIELAIAETGSVTNAQVTTAGLDGTPLSQCVVKEAMKLKFPRHPGPTMKVAVPFAWRATE
jgi:eukaryotic-like serine/threonine-protein kinase